MHVHLKHAGAAILLAAGGTLVGAAGCANDDSSLFIAGCIAVPRDTCLAVATTMPTFEGGGFIAGGLLGATYICSAQVENQLVPRGDPTTLKTETSRVVLQTADIQVLDASGGVYVRQFVSKGSMAQFTVPITGFIDVGDGTTPGLGVSDIPMIDADTIADLGMVAATKGNQLVQVQVLLNGQTTGGQDVHTQKYFLYPVTVSAGSTCLVPAGEACFGGMDKPNVDCRPGEDEPLGGVDCRLLDPCTYLDCANGLASATCPPPGQAADGSCCM